MQTLDVRLGDTLVGVLTHLGNETVMFTFDRAYVEAGGDRPTLSLGFKAADGGLVEETRPTRVRLLPFFSNLLPEGHLREYLAALGGIHPAREFLLLLLLGADLPGAIEVRSVDGHPPSAADDKGQRARGGDTRRLVFNVLIGNADAHLKNWSLIYPDRRHAKLAPAYDLVGTIPYIPNDRLALSLGDTKDFAAVDLDRFRRFAERAELPVRLVLQTVRETAAKVRDLWPTHEPLRALPDRIRAAIEAHMAAVPL